jgi:hypothetical protein
MPLGCRSYDFPLCPLNAFHNDQLQMRAMITLAWSMDYLKCLEHSHPNQLALRSFPLPITLAYFLLQVPLEGVTSSNEVDVAGNTTYRGDGGANGRSL